MIYDLPTSELLMYPVEVPLLVGSFLKVPLVHEGFLLAACMDHAWVHHHHVTVPLVVESFLREVHEFIHWKDQMHVLTMVVQRPTFHSSWGCSVP